jgi:RNA polymerase sigma factor (sigma-70 family)
MVHENTTQQQREEGQRQFYDYKIWFATRAEAEKDPEAVRLAWQVVTQSYELIHWVLRRDKGYTDTVLYDHDYDDVVSYLCEDLYNAAWNHEPSLGTFSTYAVACLRGRLIKHKTVMRVQRGPFSAPFQMGEGVRKVLNEAKKGGYTHASERISFLARAGFGERLGAYVRHINALTGSYTNVKKMKHRDEDGFFVGEGSPMDLIMDEDEDSNAESWAMNQAAREKIDQALVTLKTREQLVIRLRYGLGEGGTPHTLEQIGNVLGVSKERIRQLEAKALRKLRHPGRSRQLRDFLA